MTLTNNWYTIEEAASKFGVSTQQLQEWVDNGVIRFEGDKDKVILLNGDDIGQELHLIPSV
jgi:predicted site-specific integrase-resolvase